MFEVQQAYTYEWVTVSTHEFFDDAADAASQIMDPDRPDATRVHETPQGERYPLWEAKGWLEQHTILASQEHLVNRGAW